MRRNVFNYILLILLVLLIFGVISFGDVLNVIFYIFMGIFLLVLAGVLFFRYRMGRIRREMERQAAQGGGYRRTSGSSAADNGRSRPEGEVTVKQTRTTKKVNTQVGDYVEYEEIDEEETTVN